MRSSKVLSGHIRQLVAEEVAVEEGRERVVVAISQLLCHQYDGRRNTKKSPCLLWDIPIEGRKS